MRAWKFVLALALSALAFPTLATFHLMKIVEIFRGTAASPNAQYVVIQMYSSGQNFVHGQAITVYNASGGLINTFAFPSDVSNGTNQAKILIATPEAESFFNLTADMEMSAALIAAGGKVCYAGSIDCVAWGSYSGSSTGVGTPFNASTGLRSGKAAVRRLDISGSTTTLSAGDDTDNSANDFLEGLPAPRNNAGVLGTVPPATCGNGNIEGLEECDDHNTNNGDGCSSTCTVESGGSPPLLTIADASTSEGNSGTKTLTFTVNLSKTSAGAVTYNIATADGTASAGSDYVASSLSAQSIPAGQTSKTFAVTINGDTTVEPDENFVVNVSSVTGATVSDGQATGNITNDDAGSQPTLTIADASTTEGNAGTKVLTFTVMLSQAASTSVTYHIATSDGTATAGSDYVAKTLNPTIAAGQTSKTFAVTIDGDTTVEPNETFLVNVSNVVGASVGDGQATGTITNDDSGGTPTLSIADVSTAEGNSGTKTLTFTVLLSQSAAGAVTYDIATANGSATAGSDYVASSLIGQSIPAGQTSKTFAVTINGDTTVEPDENFVVNVSNVAGATVSDGQATGTISNDDGGSQPTLTIADASTTEGNAGTKTLTFTVMLSQAASTSVTYHIATADGTATAGSDYVAKTLSPTIAAGQTSKTFAVTIDGDTTVEPNETFLVNVSNVVGASVGDGQATGTITNDDSGGTPTLSIADVSTAEGNSGTKTLTFTVLLSQSAAGAVTYDIATANGSATAGSDYVASSLIGQSIPAGQTSKTFAVTINGDTTVEPDENFVVNVSNVAGATVSDGQATGTISNDDGSGGPTLSIADASIAEGNGYLHKNLNFTVSLSQAASGTVKFDIATSDGTAVAGSDYEASSLVGQTILAGSTSKLFRVTIDSDNEVEPDETFTVTVSNVVGASVGDGQATGTILNDDAALAHELVASLRWPAAISGRTTDDTQRVSRLAEAARLLCQDLGSPALVAMRGVREPQLLDDLVGVANSGDAFLGRSESCARLPSFRIVTANSTRAGDDAPALLVDVSELRAGVPRAELISAERLFEQSRMPGSSALLFDTPPLLARVRLNAGAPLDLDIIVLGREQQAAPPRREAQAAALSGWLSELRARDPRAAIAVAGPLAASELLGFPMGELASPRAASRGEHLIGNAPLFDAARISRNGESCANARGDAVACALAELEFLP